MRVSLLHWNRPDECLATIEALSASGLDLEMTVVDNHSQPEKLAELRARLPAGVELLELNENVGWGRAHNVVMRRWMDNESSEFCLISAHDALPVGDCLKRLVEALQMRADLGMVCPEYGNPEVPRYSVLRGATLATVSPRVRGSTEEVEFCHGTLAIFRRACLVDIGLYDEGYFAYGDEAEIGIRARRRGWKVGLVWGAVLINPGSWSGGPVIAYLWTRNSLRLAKTFGGFFGCLGRLGVVSLGTLRQIVSGKKDDLCAPRARVLAVLDFLRDRRGGPPESVLSLIKREERS